MNIAITPKPEDAVTGTAGERRATALRQAAQAKRQAAVTRTETAIRTLIKGKQEINFRSVARAAGVSLDFLYGNDDLRTRIEKLRDQQKARPAPDPGPSTRTAATSCTSSPRNSAANATRGESRSASSRNSSPPPTASSSGSAACSSSTASAPPDHAADAVMNVTTCENLAKICSNAR